jgi:pimeloyl-ACP methyl ester carboxylesterase
VWVPAQQAFEQGKIEDALRIFTDGICGQGYFDGLPLSERAGRLRNARAVQTLLQFRGSSPMLAREKIHGINVPALVVEGQHTVRVHRIADDELLRCIPGAKRAVIPAATHWTPRDNSRAFNRAVLGFLTRWQARSDRAPKPAPPRPGSRSRSQPRPCQRAPGR